MDGQEGGTDQLVQTQTIPLSGKGSQNARNSHHHGKHRHHRHHHHTRHNEAEEGDDTWAQTMLTDLENTETRQEDDTDRADEDDEEAGVPLGNFMFCDSVRKLKSVKSKLLRPDDHQIAFFSRYQQPSTTNAQTFTKGHMPGRMMVTSLFHMESNRENRGAEDDGLDDADLTAADGIIRAKKEKNQKKQIMASDNLKIVKGDFTFPHRTYKPKCQIAFRVPPGHVPQAVMAERLHRMYKKTDINLVLQTLGIELSDLIPPPTYGENNERFYEEMMFRNRTKVNGLDKSLVVARGGRLKQYGFDTDEEEEEATTTHIHKAENDSSLSSVSTSASGSIGSNNDDGKSRSTSKASKSVTDAQANDGDADAKGKTAIHPFIQSKPPFNPQFPLNFFDNSEFDIRSGEDWCRLGWDDKERRFYPLPAKAFLPLPLQPDKRAKARAYSELTMEEILRKTPRLDKFRQWLLRERFQRQIRLVGLDPAKVTRMTPSEMEMTVVARLGSAVETAASLSDDSIQEIHKAARRFSQQRSKVDGELEDLSAAAVATVGSDEGEEGEGESSSDPNLNSKSEVRDEDQLNIVYKLRQPKKDDDASDEDDKQLTQNDEAKKSVSILSDVFSDLDSLTMLGSDIITNIQRVAGVEIEATDAEDMEQDTEKEDTEGRVARGLHRPARSYFMGDYGINIPNSPDIDPFEDGLEQFVMDFDKMKKVHIYDWRWVDVAVFDYHPMNDKFFVRTISNPIVYAWVSKVYLCFDAEDPNKHGLRIKDAVKRRIEMENVMRYNLYVDCLPMIDFPNLEDEVMLRIVNRAVTASNLKFTESAMQKVKREINLEYQRSIAEEKFQKLAEKHHKTFLPWVQIPDKFETAIITTSLENVFKPIQTPHDFLPSVQLQNFEFKVKSIQKASVIYSEEAWKPYKEIVNICLDAQEKPIILTNDLLPMHLDDWEKMQLENIEEVKHYLQEEWYELVVANLKSNFEKTNKSWYNLTETNYDVYLMSKLSNFLQLIKIVLQDTMRSIVKNSCTSLMQQITAYSVNIDPQSDWSWGDDLINSEYPPPKGLKPLWVLEMFLDSDGPKYMQQLPGFYRSAYSVFSKAVQSCSKMPTLLQQVMPQMQFAALGFLRGVEENEPEMIELAHSIVKYTKLILLPLESYIRKFQKYKDVWSLDISNYVKKLEDADPSAHDIKKLVEQNRRHMEKIEKELPSTIKITAFHVVVEPVREGILKKKRTLISSILDGYAFKLRKIIQKVQKDYQEMEKKLTLRSDDIEEVMELKGYVEIVPSLVARLDNVTNAVIKDYEVFDHFMYPVSNEDVNEKWKAALNSNRILRLGREATKWLDDDYDRLLKVQQADLGSLSDQVDSATLTVAGLAAYTELEKAQDVCQEIKKIWKTIKELQEQSALLNRRQKVFGLPLAQNEALNRLTRDIEPFKNLWFTASDWLTVQETLYSGVMEKVDLEQVTRVISEGGKVIGRCIKYFAGADQIQHIAKSIKYQLEDFKPMVPLIHTLKKPELRQRHWQAITDACGFTVVERAGQSFKKLLEQGIVKYAKEVTEIGELATKEFEVEQALNKMIAGITNYEVKIIQHDAYKMPYALITPETMKTIAEYIEITNKLMENPYNTPFLEKLTMWEKKIKLSKTNLVLWVNCQVKWLQIQPTFLIPDAPTKMPVTFKLYEKMQRIWRRLIRLARDTTEILELASNNTTMASLNQFATLLVSIQKSLEEYFRPKGSDESDDD